MRTWSLIRASGMAPRHFPTKLQARAELIRSGDPSAFVAALATADLDVLAADGPRELALRLIGRAAAVECPFHGSGPGAPCEPGPARICPRRMEQAGFLPFVYGRNGAGSPEEVVAGVKPRRVPARRPQRPTASREAREYPAPAETPRFGGTDE